MRARVSGLAAATILAAATGCSDGAHTPPSEEPAGEAVVAGPARSQVRAEQPRRIELPSGARLLVRPTETDGRGVLVLPDDVDLAGWWRGSARLGDPFGAVVIAAHVDSLAEGIGPIAEILSSRRGDVVRVSGRTLFQDFEVVSTRFVRRTELAAHAGVLAFSGNRRLVLITCGGPYDASYGGYRDNVIVVARARTP